MGSETPPLAIGAVIVAAGRSTRMGGVDKTFAPLLGKPLIAHTLSRFESSPVVSEIVLVLAGESVDRGRRMVADGGYVKVRNVVAGGQRRQDSVRNGLLALSPCEYALVHDGARPVVDGSMLERAAAGNGARSGRRRGAGQGHHQAGRPRPRHRGHPRPFPALAGPDAAGVPLRPASWRPTAGATATTPTTPPWWKPSATRCGCSRAATRTSRSPPPATWWLRRRC